MRYEFSLFYSVQTLLLGARDNFVCLLLCARRGARPIFQSPGSTRVHLSVALGDGDP